MTREQPAQNGRGPSAAVLGSFEVGGGDPFLLAGGQGRTWRVRDVVLKPVDELREHAWVCAIFDTWPAHDVVRVPRPLRSSDGAWSHDGWAAHVWLEGETLCAGDDPRRFRSVSDAFHEVIALLERPAFLDDRDDPWTFGDRVAWEGVEPVGHPATLALTRRALAALTPVRSTSQAIHGDIGGNVLGSDGLPDAVIDWPLYYRPAGWALGVAAGDAICWEGPEALALLDDWSDVAEWDQLLLRAIVYRLATRGRSEALGVSWPGGSEAYVAQRRPSVEAVLSRLVR